MRKMGIILLCLIVLMPTVVVSAGWTVDDGYPSCPLIPEPTTPCPPGPEPTTPPPPEPTPKKGATFKTHVKIHYHFASLVGEWWKKPNQYFYFKDVSIVVLDGHLIHVKEGYTLIIYCGPGIDVWVLI